MALPWPPGVQLAVYRMIQGALTNVLKHAPAAAQAAVNLRYRPGGIDLEIENDDEATPQRPATTSTAPAMGRGLAGMRELAAVFGGTFESGRRDGGGWRVVTHLTLQEGPAR